MKTVPRIAHRKHVDPIPLAELSIFGKYPDFASKAYLVDVSSTGMLIHIERDDFRQKELKQAFNLDHLNGDMIRFTLVPMELEIDGIIARSSKMGKEYFEIAVDFSGEEHEYWRECLYDLIPSQEEHFYDD